MKVYVAIADLFSLMNLFTVVIYLRDQNIFSNISLVDYD